MKKTFYLLILLTAVLATGCHSSEKNYREAYEKAVANGFKFGCYGDAMLILDD